MTHLFEPLQFQRGPVMPNRFALAPMTNCQSDADGSLSEDELHWLRLRARGGFGLVMTCAAHVQARGQGFPGQLGIFDDRHIAGLQRLANALRDSGSLSIVQLHHAGIRSPRDLTGEAPVAPSAHEETGARALSLVEVEELARDFVAAAARADRAGFDGVELHGAHGYVLCQFLSPELNRRTDRYGGSPDDRARLLFEIVAGVRAQCRPDFVLGVRLSPEGHGLDLEEMRELTRRLAASGDVDFLDISLWDVNKEPDDEARRGRSLMSYFTDLELGGVPLGVAGKLMSARDVQRALDAGADFVLIGRAGILHHDFPERVRADADFAAAQLPVTRDFLRAEGLGEAFIDYMSRWPSFVAEQTEPE